MSEQKDMMQKQNGNNKEHIKTGDIKGKIEVPDKRERRDGPGGN